MKSAEGSRVRRTSLLVSIVLLAIVPRPAAAQPWADAIRRGDYEKAADLLHPIVTDPEAIGSFSTDPEAAQQLAKLYAEGLGVPRDPVLACTLSKMAYVGAMQRYQGSEQTSLAAALEVKHCGDLSAEHRNTAGQLMGCLTFGLEEQELDLGAHRARVSHQGVVLAGVEGSEVHPLQCARQFARIRVTTVRPPPNRAPGVGPRHLLEIFYWLDKTQNSTRERVLVWSVFEARGKKLENISTEPLFSAADTNWKRPAMPAEVETGLTFEMIRSGNVRWRLAGASPQRGWLLLPDNPEDRE
jgi:hypothetical protein